MANTPQTIGDVLPSNMKADYSDAVLSTSLQEAQDIAVYGMPAKSNLSPQDVQDIKSIYALYMSQSDTGTDSVFWNATPAQNQAFWSAN